MKRPSWDWFQWPRWNGWSFWTGQSSSRRLTILEVFHKLNGIVEIQPCDFSEYIIYQNYCVPALHHVICLLFNLRWPAINLFQTSSQIPSQPGFLRSHRLSAPMRQLHALVPLQFERSWKQSHWVDVLLSTDLSWSWWCPLLFYNILHMFESTLEWLV